MDKKKPMKIMERKFAVPMSANLFAIMNDAMEMGFSFKLMCLLVAGSLIYAAIEQWGDTVRTKYGDGTIVEVTKTKDPSITDSIR